MSIVQPHKDVVEVRFLYRKLLACCEERDKSNFYRVDIEDN